MSSTEKPMTATVEGRTEMENGRATELLWRKKPTVSAQLWRQLLDSSNFNPYLGHRLKNDVVYRFLKPVEEATRPAVTGADDHQKFAFERNMA